MLTLITEKPKRIKTASSCVNLSHAQIYRALLFSNTSRSDLLHTSADPQFIFQWHHPGQSDGNDLSWR